MPSRILVVQHSGIRTSKTFGVFAAFLVAGSLILTGCTTDPEPAPTVTSTKEVPTPAPTKTTQTPEPTTPEPSAEPTPPDPAQLINENTEEGAKSAATYFIEEYNFVRSTLNVSRWETIGASGCEICKAVTTEIESLTSNTQTLKGGLTKILEIYQMDEFVPGVWEVKCLISQDEAWVLGPDDTEISQIKQEEFESFVFVEFVNGSWLLSDISE